MVCAVHQSFGVVLGDVPASQLRRLRRLLGGDEPRGNLKRTATGRMRTDGRALAAVKLGRVVVPVSGGIVQGISDQPKNTDVQLTSGPAAIANCETRDAFDRAHGIFGPKGLLPAAVRLGGRNGRLSKPLAGSRPRRYPASSMTSRGVAFDSAYDQLRELQDELDGIDGIGRSSQVTMAQVRDRVLRERIGAMSDREVRKLCRYGE